MRKAKFKHLLLFIYLLIILPSVCLSQEDTVDYRIPDAIDSLDFIQTTCMGSLLSWRNDSSVIFRSPFNNHPRSKLKSNWLSVTGNVIYNYDYRSYLDTPLALRNVHQHYVQSNLKLLILNSYPFDLTFRTRRSNHGYFRNYTDVNVRFNGRTFRELIRKKVLAFIDSSYGKQELAAAKNQWNSRFSQLTELEAWLNDQVRRDQYLEYKQLLQKSPHLSAPVDSSKLRSGIDSAMLIYQKVEGLKIPDINRRDLSAAAFVEEYEHKLEKRNKLQGEWSEAKQKYEAKKQKTEAEIKSIKNKINSSSSVEELRAIAANYDIPVSPRLNKYTKFLSSLQSLGIGRSFVDYSELTVKNVSINGFHAEYKNRNYFAAAAGAVDYLFRDHLFNQRQQRPQYVTLIRYGKVSRGGSHLIFTAFRGRKNQFMFADSANRFTDVFGFSLESRIVLNRTTQITAELAKSSTGFVPIGTSRDSKFNLADKNSMAFFLHFKSEIRKTQTRFRINYRYQGGGFQSFTLYYTQNNLTTWSVLADQDFWKKRLTIQAGLRKNEFTSLYLPVNYKSNIIFKSIQASLRIRKFPFLTVAYMPSSQLSVIDNNITENRFYTFLASASHFYSVGKISGTSLLMFNRYYNDPEDTGFVYYNARNIHASQMFMFKNFSTNSAFALSTGEYDDLYTYEQGLNFSNRVFSLGGGLKYNDLNRQVQRVGFYGNAGIVFQRLKVDLNASFEHGYLPGLDHNLITSDFGRITFIKRF